MVEEGDLLFLHLPLIVFTNECTDIYDAIGSLTLRGIVVVEERVYSFSISVSLQILFTDKYTFTMLKARALFMVLNAAGL